MKRLILAFFVFILNFTMLVRFSNGQWILQNSGTTLPLNGVSTVSSGVCFAAGDSGVFLKTVNAGVNWSKSMLGLNYTFNAVKFTNANTGWIAGNSGVILKTVNAGANWTAQTSGTIQNLFSIFILNANTIFITGDSGVVLKTTNGGTGWTQQTTELRKALYAVYFSDANTGWSTGSYYIKTTNGGVNWITKMSSASRRSIFFLNPLTGWMTGLNYGKSKSTDGGETWNDTYSGYDYSPPATYTAVQFINLNVGWCAATHSLGGSVIMTTNGGANWFNEYPTTDDRQLYDMSLLTSGEGWAVGKTGTIIKRGPYIGIINIGGIVPSEYSMSRNYPNPFNPSTKFTIDIAKAGLTKISVFDIAGREVQTLMDETLQPGTYDVRFDGSGLNSGVYFVRMTAGDFTETRRMVLLK